MSSALRSRLLPLAGIFAAGTVGASSLFAHNGGFLPQSNVLGFAAQAEAAAAAAGAFNKDEFRAFKLIKKEKLTHDTNLYRFELPNNQTSGLFTASCIVVKAMLKDKPEDEKPKAVIRPYTPTSPPGAKGYVDLVVKVYPTGKIGQHMETLKIGDTLDMKGPIPKYPYTPNMKASIGMVAGGSGITPMLQVIDEVLANPADRTQLSLIFANKTEADIILKDKLDALAAKYPSRFKVHYVVTKANWGGLSWKGSIGHVNKDLIKQHLPPPGLDNVIMVCGPPGMMSAISGSKAPDYSQGEVAGVLKELGYDKTMVYKF